MTTLYQQILDMASVEINTSSIEIREAEFKNFGTRRVCQTCPRTCKQYRAPHSTLYCLAKSKAFNFLSDPI